MITKQASARQLFISEAASSLQDNFNQSWYLALLLEGDCIPVLSVESAFLLKSMVASTSSTW